MITKENFELLDDSIKEAVNNALNSLLDMSKKDYILFLAKGDYLKNLSPNPYIIDYRKWKIVDRTRLDFLSVFMNAYYSFPLKVSCIDDDKVRFHLEMMIYCHCWESYSFLRTLHRLSQLLTGQEYVWSINIEDDKKYQFIGKKTRDVLKDAYPSLYNIILKGYHSSLRNAFAHSQYEIDMETKKINLYNYGGKEWEMTEISFDDWSERFVYSVLLSYYMETITHERRNNLISTFKTDEFTIKHRSNDGQDIIERIVKYKSEDDSFIFI